MSVFFQNKLEYRDPHVEILKFSNAKERCSIRLVSKACKGIVDDTRKEVLKRLRIIDAREIQLIENFHNLEFPICRTLLNSQLILKSLESIQKFPKRIKLNLSGIKDLTNLELLKDRSHLISLDINGCEKISGEIKKLQFTPNLKTLNISNLSFVNKDHIYQIFQDCFCLHSLYADKCNQIAGSISIPNAANFGILSFRECTSITNIDFSEDATKLKILNLNRCQITKSDFLLKITNLVELSLRICSNLPSQEFRKISELTNLKKLDLARCNLDDDSLRPIWQKCINLTSLDIGNSPLRDAVPIAHHLTKLKALKLDFCSIHLPPVIGNLSNLTILGTPTITLKDLSCLVLRCTKLEKLFIQGLNVDEVKIEAKHLQIFTVLSCLQEMSFYYPDIQPLHLKSLQKLTALTYLTTNCIQYDQVMTILTQLREYRWYDLKKTQFSQIKRADFIQKR